MINYLKDIKKETLIGLLPDVINSNNESIRNEFNWIFDSSLNRLTKSVYAPTGSVKAHFGEFVNLACEYFTVKNVDSLTASILDSVESIINKSLNTSSMQIVMAALTNIANSSFIDPSLYDISALCDVSTLIVNHNVLNNRFNNIDFDDDAQLDFKHDAGAIIYKKENDEYISVEDKLNYIDAAIDNVNVNIETLSNTVEICNTSINNLNTAINDINTSINEINVNVETLSNTVGTYNTSINNLNTIIYDLSANVETLSNTVRTYDNSINALNNSVDILSSNIEISNTSINNVNSSVGDLNSTVNDLNSSVSDLNSTVNDLNSSVSDLNSTVNDLDSSIGNINSSISNVNSSIGNINSSISNINSSISNINSSISNINSSIGNLRNSISSVSTTVGEIVSHVNNDIDPSLNNLLYNIIDKDRYNEYENALVTPNVYNDIRLKVEELEIGTLENPIKIGIDPEIFIEKILVDPQHINEITIRINCYLQETYILFDNENVGSDFAWPGLSWDNVLFENIDVVSVVDYNNYIFVLSNDYPSDLINTCYEIKIRYNTYIDVDNIELFAPRYTVSFKKFYKVEQQ